MKNILLKSLTLILFLGIIGVCIGCSKQEEVKPQNIVFGQESQTSTKFEILNNSGKDVASVSVKYSGQEATTKLESNPANEKWEKDKTADIYLNKSASTSASTEAGNIAVKSTCDIILTFSDNTNATLHNIVSGSVDKFEDAKLCFSTADNLAYIEYSESGNNVSTLAAEQKIIADAKAAEEAARQQAEAANAAKNSNNYSPSYSDSSSSSSQYTEGCTDGNIAIR